MKKRNRKLYYGSKEEVTALAENVNGYFESCMLREINGQEEERNIVP